MADEIYQPPYIYAGLDPAENDDRFGIKQPSAAVKSLSDIVEGAKKPGMPLSILSNVAREAPLGSLMVAFVLGVIVGRRRTHLSNFRRRGSQPEGIHERASGISLSFWRSARPRPWHGPPVTICQPFWPSRLREKLASRTIGSLQHSQDR